MNAPDSSLAPPPLAAAAQSGAGMRLRAPDELRDARVAGVALLLRGLNPLIVGGVFCALAAVLRVPVRGELLAAAVVSALLAHGLLRATAHRQPWPEGAAALIAEVIGSFALLAGVAILIGVTTGVMQRLPAAIVFGWLIAAPAALVAVHLGARGLLRAAWRAAPHCERAVVVGAGMAGRRIGGHLGRAAERGWRFLGYFEDRSSARVGDPGAALLGTLADAPAFVREHGIEHVYVTLPTVGDARVRALVNALRDTTASVYFVPQLDLADVVQARVDLMGGLPVIGVRESPYYGVNAVLKRGFDVALAATALLALAPLLAGIALAVRIDSPGPVLFRQRRYGMGGREITVYKFRSMRVLEDDAQIVQVRRGDARVTRVGRFLRRWSLDELPQFVNVLQGRMSVVGPRPHAVAHNEFYRRQITGYMLRHKAKPGITGWAQVNGLRGETETLDKMHARIGCDLDYLRHWSLGLDLRIVARTVLVLLRGETAY